MTDNLFSPSLQYNPFAAEPDNLFERYSDKAMLLACCCTDSRLNDVELDWYGDNIKRAPLNEDTNVIPFLSRVARNKGEAPDRLAEAILFLALLDPTATYFTFQTFDDDEERRAERKRKQAEINERRKAKGKKAITLKDPFAHVFNGTLDKYWVRLCQLNAQGAGIFVTVNETDGRGRQTTNVERVRALFDDLDGAPLDPVLQSKQPPHLVVESSPGKFHTYRFVTGIKLKTFADLQKALVAQFGGDPAVHDLPRVMRLPGFLHQKCKLKPSMVRIVSTLDAPRYGADDFKDLVAAKEKVKNFFENIDQMRSDAVGASEWQQLNSLALAHMDKWVPEIFPDATPYHDGGYRVSSVSLGRKLQEDISFTKGGIKDFGVHDQEDPREGKRTPIDIVMEWEFDVTAEDLAKRESTDTFQQAVAWLRERLPKQEAKQTEPPKEYRSYFLEELRQRTLVPLQWVAENFILAQTVNGLFGDGGIGKDLLLFQLAIAMTCGAQWLGCDVKQGRVMYFPVEDDDKELRRRQDRIESYYASLGTFDPVPKQLKITPLVGEDTVLAAFNQKAGIVVPRPAYITLCDMIEKFKPDLVIVGNRVNIFSVNQNDDAQARQCMQLLSWICQQYQTTVIMPSHVSLSSQKSGEGTSGSVQWSNACRMRLYLRYVKDENGEPVDDYQRELQVMKANWSATGKTATMSWNEGVFKPDDLIEIELKESGPSVDQQKVEDENEVLRMLDDLVEGAHVSPNLNAPNTIFKKFLKGRFRGHRGRLEAAVKRLYDKKVIETIAEGPPSRQRHHVGRRQK